MTNGEKKRYEGPELLRDILQRTMNGVMLHIANKERRSPMKGILKRLKNAEGMRDDEVQGEFWSWPKIGKCFCFFKFTNGKMRLIETSHVTKITERKAGNLVFEAKDGVFQIIMTGE